MKRKSVVSLLVKLAISAILVAVLSFGIDFGETFSTIAHADLIDLALSVVILMALIALGALRWKLVSDLQNPGLPLGRATVVMLIGWFFNQALPSTIGGDVVRGHLLWNDYLDKTKFVSAIMIDRLIGLFVVVVFTTVFLSDIDETLGGGLPYIGLLVLVGVAYVCYAIAITSDLLLARWTPFPALARFTAGFSKAFRAVITSPALFAKILAIGLIYQLAFLYSIFLVFESVDASVSFLEVLILMPAIQLISSIPVSYSGWGVREQSIVFAFGMAGLASSTAFAASVLMGLMFIVAGFPGAILWFIFRRS